MKFLELNKKRHAIKHFTDQPVDPKDVRTAIEIATLAPSAHNSQPWKFVVVRQKNAELAKLAYGANYDQVMEAPVTVSYTHLSWTMLLYAGFFGPITEEFFFRGAGLRGLERYGKIFAIVMTAILFGLFHANFDQLFFASIIGLGFGYIAFEYNIWWAIFYHIFNNFVISQGLHYVAYHCLLYTSRCV